MPPLNALRAFDAAARHLNFRRAAEELNVTQGAVAQHVRGLEASLGVQLFSRLPRGLSLTDEGRRFAAPLRKAFALISDAVDEIRPARHTLKISVTPSFAARWLVPRLARMADDNPDFDIDIVATDALSNFQSDGIDIAVRQTRPPFPSGLKAEHLFPARFIPICSPQFSKGKTLKPADISEYLLLQDSHGLWPLYFETHGSTRSVQLPKTINFSQTHLAIDAAIAGQGIALVCDIFVERELADGRLVRPMPQVLESDAAFYVVSPRRARKEAMVGRLREWLMAAS